MQVYYKRGEEYIICCSCPGGEGRVDSNGNRKHAEQLENKFLKYPFTATDQFRQNPAQQFHDPIFWERLRLPFHC